MYVLFFIELGNRRARVAGCTAHPHPAWVAQQARQLAWTLADGPIPMRFLIHDRDSKFISAFDAVFRSERLEIIRTPLRAPKANAFAERWIQSVCDECLTRLLIINQRHLKQVLAEYAVHYNVKCPHQGLKQQIPIPYQPPLDMPHSIIRRHNILGGIIHDYFRQAA